MNFFIVLSVMSIGLASFSGWCEEPIKDTHECQDGLVEIEPDQYHYLMTDGHGARHTIREKDIVSLDLINDNEGFPNPVRGVVTKVGDEGVTVNDWCLIPWKNINQTRVLVFPHESIVPVTFGVIAQELSDHIQMRSEILARGTSDVWHSSLLKHYDGIRLLTSSSILVDAANVQNALHLIIALAATPGGQAYVDLLENSFQLIGPGQRYIPWVEVFGKTDLAKNGLGQLELKMTLLMKTSQRPQ